MVANKKNKDVPSATEAVPAPAKRLPIKTIRVGDVSASIWSREHQTKDGTLTFHSVSFERSYKDRDGAYRYTKSFDADDLGGLVTAAQEASEYLHNLTNPDSMLPGREGGRAA
jgi:hypothetical protein